MVIKTFGFGSGVGGEGEIYSHTPQYGDFPNLRTVAGILHLIRFCYFSCIKLCCGTSPNPNLVVSSYVVVRDQMPTSLYQVMLWYVTKCQPRCIKLCRGTSPNPNLVVSSNVVVRHQMPTSLFQVMSIVHLIISYLYHCMTKAILYGLHYLITYSWFYKLTISQR